MPAKKPPVVVLLSWLLEKATSAHSLLHPPLSNKIAQVPITLPAEERHLFRLPTSAALNAPRHGAVDVVVGDPALVVALGAVAAAGGAGRLGARERLDLGGRGLAGSSRLLAAGRGNARLREESLDPGLVDEVEGRAEDGGEEEVEEDAV